MKKIFWYFKQLFPLTYRSHYKENGNKKFSVWEIWFGRCYKVETFSIL